MAYRVVQRGLISLPLISLIIMVASWLTFGLDLPYMDDWRGYLSGEITRVDLAHLFKPENDTISPVGRLLDALAQTALRGNSIAYQFFSMLLVLGGVLAISWSVIKRTSSRPLDAAIAFALFVFLLQPESYWGLQNIAYQQAIPVVAILLAIRIAIETPSRIAIAAVSIFVLMLVAGWSYTSGAVGGLAVCLVLLVIGILDQARSKSLVLAASAGLVGSLITTATQAWVIIHHQSGQIHTGTTGWILPYQSEFWGYALGKIGRALMLHTAPVHIGLPISALVLAVIALLAVILAINIVRSRSASDLNIATLSLIALAGVYLTMVSASRAGLIGRPAAFTEMYVYGFARFHFFWLCLLWPFVYLAVSALCRFLNMHSVQRFAVRPMAIGATVFAVYSGAMSHGASFQKISSARLSTEYPCILRHIGDSGPIDCPSLHPHTDMRPAFEYSARTGASWIRYFDGIVPGLPVRVSSEDVVNAQASSAPDSLSLQAGVDPQVLFRDPWPFPPSECTRIVFDVVIQPRDDDLAQLFFSAPGQGFSEDRSVTVPIAGGQRNELQFEAVSEQGFASPLRLDPVAMSQPVTVDQPRLRCSSRR